MLPLLYGAISGECYINGVVGEICCDLSNCHSVVDHGEYMTGGVVVIIGRNFAAECLEYCMVTDKDDEFISMAMVEVERKR